MTRTTLRCRRLRAAEDPVVGDRNFAVQDPYGYRLWFCQTVTEWKEVSPPPGVKVV